MNKRSVKIFLLSCVLVLSLVSLALASAMAIYDNTGMRFLDESAKVAVILPDAGFPLGIAGAILSAIGFFVMSHSGE